MTGFVALGLVDGALGSGAEAWGVGAIGLVLLTPTVVLGVLHVAAARR